MRALGESEEDYRGKIGTDMVQGITPRQSRSYSKDVHTSRKALIVVGDGHDTNNDAAKSPAHTAQEAGAQAEHPDCSRSSTRRRCRARATSSPTMIPTTKHGELGRRHRDASSNAIIARMDDRYYLTFPGYDKKIKTGLPWDGKAHDLVVKIDKDESEPVDAARSRRSGARRRSGGFPWLVDHPRRSSALLLLIVIVAKVVQQQEGRADGGADADADRADAVEAPKPAGPMKTVMIGAGGDRRRLPDRRLARRRSTGQHAYQTLPPALGHARRSAPRRRPTSSSTTAS